MEKKEELDAIRVILGLIILGGMIGASIASAYWYAHCSSESSEESEAMARYTIINLDRANTYLMRADNQTATLFLDSALFTVPYELDDEISYDILWVETQLKENFNISKIPIFTNKINETILKLMPFSDIIKYKDFPEFEKLYDKYWRQVSE